MDQIFYHGCFYTPYDTAVQAVGVKNGRIVAIGTDQQLLNQADSTTQLVDLEGKRVVPGFIDSHCHLLLAGLAYEQLDLHGCRSPREMVERGRAYIKERQLPAGTWVVGGGYDHNQFDEPVLPDGRVAEAISSVHPVMFERVCGHVGAANPLALCLAGFDESTVIEGGVLDKDSKGRLTGVLRETALDQFKLKIPLPDVDTLARALQRAIAVANQDGVTSVHSDDVMTVPVEDFLKAVDQLKEKGQFHIRIWEEFEAARPPLLRKLISRGQRTGDGDQWYRCGNLKLLLDGSLGARTASLREPYCDDPENKGIQVYLQEDLEEMVRLAHENRLQIAFHAIGDRAVEQALTAVEKVQRACPRDLRHRLVHCQIADPSFFPRMAACGLAVDGQPSFTATDWPLLRSRLGERREKGCYAWRSLLDAGVLVAGGSDCPVDPFAPLWGMLCAVTREDAQGCPKGGWMPEEKLTIPQALDLYTRNAAALEFAEKEKGAIQVGALADFVVLSQDFLDPRLDFSIALDRLKNAKVTGTIVGGKLVYQA